MLADVAPYVPVILLTLFVNTADIYFLQGDRKPLLQRSPSSQRRSPLALYETPFDFWLTPFKQTQLLCSLKSTQLVAIAR